VTPSVETTDPDGIDFGWIMQVTFVLTITLGSVVVAVLSLGTSLPTWQSRVAFAVRVGAVVWLLTASGAYVYARRYRNDEHEESGDSLEA
jgi:membrane protein YdbS with pleckstrin-like domain